MAYTITNPSTRGSLKPVTLITDRAKRYRAVKNAPPRHSCYLCGNPKAADVEHIDGHEANNEPANLAWSCRSCNVKKGRHFARNGFGSKTNQRNPRRTKGGGRGAYNLPQYLTAVMVSKGESDRMPLDQAIEILKATGPEKRASFARDVWNIRRARQAEIPF